MAAFLKAFHGVGCRHIEIDFLGNPEERQAQIELFGHK